MVSNIFKIGGDYSDILYSKVKPKPKGDIKLVKEMRATDNKKINLTKTATGATPSAMDRIGKIKIKGAK